MWQFLALGSRRIGNGVCPRWGILARYTVLVGVSVCYTFCSVSFWRAVGVGDQSHRLTSSIPHLVRSKTAARHVSHNQHQASPTCQSLQKPAQNTATTAGQLLSIFNLTSDAGVVMLSFFESHSDEHETGLVIDLAVNFYLSSQVQLQQQPPLVFISFIDGACSRLLALGATRCHYFYHIAETLGITVNNHTSFSHYKADLVRRLLTEGVSLLCISPNIHLFKDPLIHIREMTNLDIITTPHDEDHELSFDFTWFNATSCSMEFLDKLLGAGRGETRGVLNRIPVPGIPTRIHILNSKLYPNSFMYFDKYERHFADSTLECEDCVLVRTSDRPPAERIYRFKEAHMWNYDKEGYYTNSQTKYITFDNPNIEVEDTMIPLEESALLSALMIGQWLGRVVILPKFHCYGIWCPLHSRYDLSTFDRTLATRYRENTFLRHALVPGEIRKNKTAPILFDGSPECFSQLPLDDLDSIILLANKKADNTGDVTRHDVEKWLAGYRHYSVIHFLCLYNAIPRRHISDYIRRSLVSARQHYNI